MIKKLFVLFASFSVGLAIFLWTIGGIGWESVKSVFFVFPGWHILTIFGLTFAAVLIGVWKWQEILGKDSKISFRNLFGPYFAGYALMFLAPVLFWGGEMFRAHSLKENYSLSWPKSMASVAIDRILEWTVSLITVFFGGIALLFLIGLPQRRLMAGLGLLFLIAVFCLLFFYFKCVKKESIAGLFFRNKQNQVMEIEKEIFSFFKIRNGSMWRAFFITFLRTAVLYLRAWLLMLFLGKKVGFAAALSVLGFYYLATMVPVPAALGVHEVAQIFVFESFSFEKSVAAAFAMIIRSAEFLVALAGAMALFGIGLELLKSAVFRKMDKAIIK